MNSGFWRSKRVFVTGHTGFKGGWLSVWLQDLGAHVYGYALPPATDPSLFAAAGVAQSITVSQFADIRDSAYLLQAMKSAEPDIVFHLAAQPLVRYSYSHPAETYAVNVMGLVNILEAVREVRPKVVINVTSDKCYENQEWHWGYREGDRLGGNDPYSNSKACAELVTQSYRKSFLQEAGVGLASARAGNVIGGGDWAIDRLIPDALRALDSEAVLQVRSPDAVRPWQHVLEPLAGYLNLAEHLFNDPFRYAQAWNFGPAYQDARPVRWILECLKERLPAFSWQVAREVRVPEAQFLKLDSSKAQSELKWHPRWSLTVALEKTIEWHQAWRTRANMEKKTRAQIAEFMSSSSRG